MKKILLSALLITSVSAYSREIMFNGSFVHSTNNHGFEAGALSVGIPIYYFNDPSYFLTVDPFISLGEGAVDVGGTFSLFKRFDLSEKWFLDCSLSVGMMNLDNQKVHQSQGFNFTERAGVTLSYKLSSISSLGIGGGISHISNAGITDRNPGVDSYSVGLRYTRQF